MRLYNYLKKRADEISNCDRVDSLYTEESLTALIVRFCRKTNRVADFDDPVIVNCWNYDTESYSDVVIPWIINPGIEYQEITTSGRENADDKGMYVHMLNQHIDNFSDFINDFKKIDGEICVSEIGDEQLTRFSEAKLGLILRGTPTATFTCDCWSELDSNGRRYATRSDSYSNRSESWLIPANSEIVGIVYSDKSFDDAEKLSKICKAELFVSFTAIDNEKSNMDIDDCIDYIQFNNLQIPGFVQCPDSRDFIHNCDHIYGCIQDHKNHNNQIIDYYDNLQDKFFA